MELKIKDFVLNWNYVLKIGTIILVFDGNTEPKAIRKLSQLDFLCIKNVLDKGNTYINFADDSIYNKNN